MALGAFAAGTTEVGRETGFGWPLAYTVMALTLVCQKSVPKPDGETVAYSILVGSETRDSGWRPMPSTDGTRSDPGRSRAREKKRAPGAVLSGDMLKRLDDKEAPSGTSLVAVGSWRAMREFPGRARPITPLKLEERGSLLTLAAATKQETSRRTG